LRERSQFAKDQSLMILADGPQSVAKRLTAFQQSLMEHAAATTDRKVKGVETYAGRFGTRRWSVLNETGPAESIAAISPSTSVPVARGFACFGNCSELKLALFAIVEARPPWLSTATPTVRVGGNEWKTARSAPGKRFEPRTYPMDY
jgi:hypothetical protein